LLAGHVARLETQIYSGAFVDHALDESLVAEFHHGICAELVPDWAGRCGRRNGLSGGNREVSGLFGTFSFS
jgi:hypothetical protein